MPRFASAASLVTFLCVVSPLAIHAQPPGKQKAPGELDQAKRLCRAADRVFEDVGKFFSADVRTEAILRCLQTETVKRLSSSHDEVKRALTGRDFENCPAAQHVLRNGLRRINLALGEAVPPAFDIPCQVALRVHAALSGWRPPWAACGIFTASGDTDELAGMKRWLSHFGECLDLKKNHAHREMVRTALERNCPNGLKDIMAVYRPLVAPIHPKFATDGPLDTSKPPRCDQLLELARDAGIVDSAGGDAIAAKQLQEQKQAQAAVAHAAKLAEEQRKARAEECRKSGAGDKEPHVAFAGNAFSEFYLNNCSNSQQLALLFQSGGARANPLAVAATNFTRRGSACVLSSFGVQMSLAVDQLSSLNCRRERQGRFRCTGYVTFRCSTNASQPGREAFECAIWRSPLPIEFTIASNEVCEWSVATR